MVISLVDQKYLNRMTFMRVFARRKIQKRDMNALGGHCNERHNLKACVEE